MTAGEAIILRERTWHLVPFPISETATFLLLQTETSEHPTQVRNILALGLDPPSRDNASGSVLGLFPRSHWTDPTPILPCLSRS